MRRTAGAEKREEGEGSNGAGGWWSYPVATEIELAITLGANSSSCMPLRVICVVDDLDNDFVEIQERR